MTKQEIARYIAEIRAICQSDIAEFGDRSPGGQSKRKMRAREEFEYFCQSYLPNYFTSPSGQFHFTVDGSLERRDNDIVICIGPREHAKTVRWSIAYILHQIIFKKRRFVLLVSETEDMAIQQLLNIRVHLESNKRILSDYGTFKGNSVWSENEIVTLHNVKVLARGYKQPVRGLLFGPYRPDLIRIDDISNLKASRNELLEKEKCEWILSELFGCMAVDGTLFWTENINRRTSAVAQAKLRSLGGARIEVFHFAALIYNHGVSEIQRRDAVVTFVDERSSPLQREDERSSPLRREDERSSPLRREDERSSPLQREDEGSSPLQIGAVDQVRAGVATPLWPERYSLGYFEDKRQKIGTKLFEREYMQNPVTEGTFYHLDWFRRFKFTEGLSLWSQCTNRIIYLDPSYGKKKKSSKDRGSDKKVAVVMGSLGDEVFLLDALSGQKSIDSFCKGVCYLYDKWRPRYVYYEGNFGQDFLVGRFLHDAEQLTGIRLPLKPYYTRNAKQDRIEFPAPFVERGQVYAVESVPDVEDVLSNLELYPDLEFDDPADAFGTGFEILERDRNTVRAFFRKRR